MILTIGILGENFLSILLGKSNLLFMKDDVENNRFGGYINSPITNSDIYINDPNAFIFSLKSNRRLNHPMIFRINTPENAFISFTTHDRYIFAFGGGYDIKLDIKKLVIWQIQILLHITLEQI